MNFEQTCHGHSIKPTNESADQAAHTGNSNWLELALCPTFCVALLMMIVGCGSNTSTAQNNSRAQRAKTAARTTPQPVYSGPLTIQMRDLQKSTPLPGLRTGATAALPYSPFGLHAAGGAPKFRPQLKVNFLRQIVAWNQIEQRKGAYRFQKADAGVRYVHDAGFELVVTLRPVSKWAVNIDHAGLARRPKMSQNNRSDDFLWSGYPHDLNTWLAMVRACVERYDGDGVNDMPGLKKPINYWQIDNEILWQWQSPIEDYVRLFNATAREIKRANPRAKVILGAIDQCSSLAFVDGAGEMEYLWHGQKNPKRYTRQQVMSHPRYQGYKRKAAIVLEQAGPNCDVIDFHDYGQEADDLAAVVEWLNKETKRHGYQRPIWSLENAGPFFQFTPQLFSEAIVKRHVVGVSAGVSALFWSSLHPTTAWSENFTRLSLLDTKATPKPAFKTYMMLTEELHDMESIQKVFDDQGVEVYLATFKDQQKYIAWSGQGTRDVKLEVGTVAKDLAATPIYWKSVNTPPKTTRLTATNGTINLVLTTTPVLVKPISD